MKRFVYILFVIALVFQYGVKTADAADDENCLMCHKYIKMGRITEEGERRYYYINEPIFSKTVHSRVKCRDCHSYIEKLPHDPVKEGVTCNSRCHSIQNPATKKDFDHQNIYDVYMKSVHGREKVPATKTDKNKPYCTFCHTNPLYIPATYANPDDDPRSEKIPTDLADRCDVCHQKREFVEHRYLHTARRILNVKRSPREVVQLCLICHGSKEFLERHERVAKEEGKHLGEKFISAGESYLRSFHGSFMKLGWEKPANCLSCHADNKNYFLSVHDIRSAKDPKSTTHPDNRHKVCARCHEGAGKNFSKIDEVHYNPHENHPIEYYVENFFFWLTSGAFFALISLITLDHHRRMWDVIRGKGHFGSH
ncbi:MAG: hypothetical protein A2073_01475 [Deltaproteobacteria bacterium GWC2_42_11]|nr:MAG: hypothetical protein A2073_01475 [Deltaproteobacteria bacterium GWC2_42_11]HBO84850.1 hypothetical protein [Deltaproteobacteria bacterium]